MKKAIKVISGLAMIATLATGIYTSKDISPKESATDIQSKEIQTFADPGGGPGY